MFIPKNRVIKYSNMFVKPWTSIYCYKSFHSSEKSFYKILKHFVTKGLGPKVHKSMWTSRKDLEIFIWGGKPFQQGVTVGPWVGVPT